MMNRYTRALAIAAVVAFSGIWAADSTPAVGQQSAPVVIGIVDVERIMQDSKAAKSIRAQLDQQKKAFQAEVDKQQKLIDDAKQKLLAQQSTLSKPDLQKKGEELNKQVAQIEKNLNRRQNQLEDGVARARNQVYDTMRLAAADVAKDKGLTFVVQKGATLVYASEAEITDEVLKRLDAKLPSVKLQMSSGAQGGTTSGTATSSSTATQGSSQGSTTPDLQGLGGSSGEGQ